MRYNTEYYYKHYKASGGILSYEKYKEVIFSFNKKIIENLIKTGKSYMLRSHLGFLSVVKYEKKFKLNENGNLKGAVDWGQSNKLKKQILDRGGLPFENYKDDKGKIIGDNGGEKWLCYHLDPYTFGWSYTPDIYLTNGVKTKFTLSWTNKKLLSKSIDENSELIFKNYASKNNIV